MNEMIEIQRKLYMTEVENLLQRPASEAEKIAIQEAFARHWSSQETAQRITGTSPRIDRQNDLA